MDATSFVQAVREKLHPGTYAGLLQVAGSPYDLLLARNGGKLSHDIFGVIELLPGVEPRVLVEAARADVGSRFGALCYRRSITLHLLVHGPYQTWRDAMSGLCADRSGFRGVMIQSIYVVDPSTGTGHKSSSRWGVLRYSRQSERTASEVRTVVEPLLLQA